MNFRQARELDNHITGHYGEDQFRDWTEFPDTTHAQYRQSLGDDVYNPADDGPEVDIIMTINPAVILEYLTNEYNAYRKFI